ncbi:hypothetical protein SPRG_16441, partial [Saprolegnia parasitica CBS 223.65]
MPPKPKATSPTKKKAKETKASDAIASDTPKSGDVPAQATETDDADIYHEPVKKIVVPDNQLRLNEQELKEEFSRVLTANDPNVPNNITKYNYKERMYKVDPPGPATTCSMIHKESEDAKAQAAYDMKKAEEEKEARDAAIKIAKEEAEAKGEKLDETALQFESGKNQFNYSERAAQTYTNPLRQRSVETEPPPVLNYMATVTQ